MHLYTSTATTESSSCYMAYLILSLLAMWSIGLPIITKHNYIPDYQLILYFNLFFLTKRTCIRLNLSACLISHGTMFFSHDKSANSTFQSGFLAKRTWPTCVVVFMIALSLIVMLEWNILFNEECLFCSFGNLWLHQGYSAGTVPKHLDLQRSKDVTWCCWKQFCCCGPWCTSRVYITQCLLLTHNLWWRYEAVALC